MKARRVVAVRLRPRVTVVSLVVPPLVPKWAQFLWTVALSRFLFVPSALTQVVTLLCLPTNPVLESTRLTSRLWATPDPLGSPLEKWVTRFTTQLQLTMVEVKRMNLKLTRLVLLGMGGLLPLAPFRRVPRCRVALRQVFPKL